MTIPVAVLTAVFPAVLPQMEELKKSLKRQTFREFRWVLINDGCSVSELNKLQRDFPGIEVIDCSGQPPSVNRLTGMRQCKDNGFLYIISQDADDWMADDRIAESVTALEKESLVFSDLSLVNQDGSLITDAIWKGRLHVDEIIDAVFLEEKNCLGLGNTSIRSEIVSDVLEIPSDLIATDWYLFYHLVQHRRAVFSPSPVYYRQYPGNIAGIGVLSARSIERCVTAKKKHYQALAPEFPVFQVHIQRLDEFEREIYLQQQELERYILENRSRSITSFWWEETNYHL